eukprot:4912148-Pleurochrysis_carterae.AAC.2
MAGLVDSDAGEDNGTERGCSLAPLAACGRPGGWSRPVSATAVATGKLAAGSFCFQGNEFSSK